MTHLWEVDHPYYCSESNYYSNDAGATFESWEEFKTDGGLLYDGDEDLNFVFRWDWNVYNDDGEDPINQLELFFMLQRKGIFCPVLVKNMTPEDEDEVRAWLKDRAMAVRATWEPLLDVY